MPIAEIVSISPTTCRPNIAERPAFSHAASRDFLFAQPAHNLARPDTNR
jgi:hypothetical protein